MTVWIADQNGDVLSQLSTVRFEVIKPIEYIYLLDSYPSHYLHVTLFYVTLANTLM